MRTTVDLPDELLAQAKSSAALPGISLRRFFIEAMQQRLAPEKRKVRKSLPGIGDARGPRMKALTRKRIDEALFGDKPPALQCLAVGVGFGLPVPLVTRVLVALTEILAIPSRRAK